MLFAFLLSTLDCFSLRWFFFTSQGYFTKPINSETFVKFVSFHIFHWTFEINLSTSHFYIIKFTYDDDDDVMEKKTEKGDQEMPAHSTMCIYMAHWSCLPWPPTTFKDQEQCLCT